jgi:hypothetical protein
MEKKFKLPKPFGVKWLEALRSGEYQQSTSELVTIDKSEIEPTVDATGFCCLGVAGHLCGYKLNELDGDGFLYAIKFSNVPLEIQNGPYNLNLVQLVSELNDGSVNVHERKNYETQGFIFREIEANEHDEIKYDFSQIADFIEDNVEFYEIETEEVK